MLVGTCSLGKSKMHGNTSRRILLLRVAFAFTRITTELKGLLNKRICQYVHAKQNSGNLPDIIYRTQDLSNHLWTHLSSHFWGRIVLEESTHWETRNGIDYISIRWFVPGNVKFIPPSIWPIEFDHWTWVASRWITVIVKSEARI